MTSTTDIVARLREATRVFPSLVRLFPDPDGPNLYTIAHAAIAHIEALEAEVAKLREAAPSIEALEAEVVRLREHLSKAVLSEDIVMQMAGFTDPRNVSCADDELNLFAELIEEAKQIHGDLYEGAALEGQS